MTKPSRDHDDIVADARVHHLVRVLESYRVMHRDAFCEAAATSSWHESSFGAALASAVNSGAIERLPGDFYRIPGYDAEPGDADGSSAREHRVT